MAREKEATKAAVRLARLRHCRTSSMAGRLSGYATTMSNICSRRHRPMVWNTRCSRRRRQASNPAAPAGPCEHRLSLWAPNPGRMQHHRLQCFYQPGLSPKLGEQSSLHIGKIVDDMEWNTEAWPDSDRSRTWSSSSNARNCSGTSATNRSAPSSRLCW